MNASPLSPAPFLPLLAVGIALSTSPCPADEPPIPIPASAGPPAYRVVREDFPDQKPFARKAMELGLRTGATVIPWDYDSWPAGQRSGTAIGPAWGGFALLRFDDWSMGLSFERSLLSWPARASNYPTASFTTTVMGPFVRFPFVHSGRADPYLQVGMQAWSVDTPYPSGDSGCGTSVVVAFSAELGADWFVSDFLKLGPYVAMPFPVFPLSAGCSTEDDVKAGSANSPQPPNVKYSVSFGLATTFAVVEPIKRHGDHRY